jgi:tetratricopeptide (TPR) repeat protein
MKGPPNAVYANMKLTKPALVLCFLLFSGINLSHAATTHSIKGLVITNDGTPVPDFSVVVRQAGDKPELLRRRRFKNGEFSVDGLTTEKFQIQISSPLFITSKINVDLKSEPLWSNYCIVILHTYRNERRLTPGLAYSVSVKALQQKIPDKAEDAYKKAVEMHRSGKLEQAMIEYGRAIRVYPQYVQALADLSTIFILYDRPTSALTFLRRAQDLDDSNPIVNLNAAIALTEQREYGSALKLLKKVLRDQPGMALAHFYTAHVYFAQRKFDQAEEEARQAVNIDPKLLDGWLLVVHSSLEQKDYNAARDGLVHLRDAMGAKTETEFIDEQLSTLDAS